MKNYIVVSIMALFLSLANIPQSTSSSFNLPECCKRNEACCVDGGACCLDKKAEKSSSCCSDQKASCEEGAACCSNKRGFKTSKKAYKKQQVSRLTYPTLSKI